MRDYIHAHTNLVCVRACLCVRARACACVSHTRMQVIKHVKYYFTWYRFVKRFEWPLLAQSIIMIVTMLMLLHLCVRVSYEKDSVTIVQRRFVGKNAKVVSYTCYRIISRF